MRYRERGTQDIYSNTLSYTRKLVSRKKQWVSGQWVYTDSVSYNSYGAKGYPDNRETISDKFETPNLYNPVAHSRSYNIPLSSRLANDVQNFPSWGSPNSWYVVEDDLGTLVGYTNPHYLFSGHIWPQPSGEFSPNFGDIVNKVGTQLDGSMVSRTLVLEQLATLSQTVGMIKNPFGLLTHNWRRGVKNFSPRQLMKAGANVWLEKRYGWDNLFRDIVSFSQCHQKVSEHIQYLSQTRGRWVTIAEKLQDALSPNPSTISQIGTTGVLAWIQFIISDFSQSSEFTVQVLRDKSCRILSRGELTSQYIGVNKLVETLWEVLPLSFCIDWFIDIADLVSRTSIAWNTHRLRRMGYSTKRSLSITPIVNSKVTTWAGSTTKTDVLGPSLVYKQYQRNPGFPPDCSTVGLFGGLSLTNLATGAALIAQRI